MANGKQPQTLNSITTGDFAHSITTGDFANAALTSLLCLAAFAGAFALLVAIFW